MHCELLVPDLFAAEEGGAPPRLASLELLLARGRCSENESENEARSLEGWLAYEFGCDAPLPAGALSVLADGGEPGDTLWLRADPIHLAIEREHARATQSR